MLYHDLGCNNLNFVEAEAMKNIGSDRFWVCMYCSNNLFPFATTNNNNLHQTSVRAINTTVKVLTAILLRHVQH